MSPQKILITGSTDGIGLATAKLLSSQGHSIYLHARSPSRASQAKQLLPSASGILIGDLSSLSSTRALAASALETGPFDAVIHNAGVIGEGGKTSEEGYDKIFQVNSLAPYVLSALMGKAAAKRWMVVSSSMHRSGDEGLGDIAGKTRGGNKKRQGVWGEYSDSKYQNVLLANYLAGRWTDVQCCAFDPGWVKTKLAMGGAPGEVATPAKAMAAFATGENEHVGGKSGVYFSPSGIQSPLQSTFDKGKQEEYIKLCEELSGISISD